MKKEQNYTLFAIIREIYLVWRYALIKQKIQK